MMQLRRGVMMFAAAGVMCLAAQSATATETPAANGLELVPADSLLVISVRLRDFRDNPLLKLEPKELEKKSPEPFQLFRRYIGVSIEDVDQLVVFVPPPAGKFQIAEPLLIVTTIKPYEKKALLDRVTPKDQKPEWGESKLHPHILYDIPGVGTGFYFHNDHTFIVSKFTTVAGFLNDTKVTKEGPMAPVMKIADKHLVVAGADLAALRKPFAPLDHLPPDAEPLLSIFKSRFTVLTVDLDEKLRADLKVIFANEADAKEGTAAVDALLEMERSGAEYVIQEMTKEGGRKQPALLKDVQAGLKSAKAEQNGTTVHVAAALKIDQEALTAALIESVPKVVEHPGNRRKRGNKSDLDK